MTEPKPRPAVRRSTLIAVAVVVVLLVASWLALGQGTPPAAPPAGPPTVTVTVEPSEGAPVEPLPADPSVSMPVGDPAADLSSVTFPQQLGQVFTNSGSTYESGIASATYVSREDTPRSFVANVVARSDGLSVPPGIPTCQGDPERIVCTIEDGTLLMTIAADRNLFREDDVLAILTEWHSLSIG